MLGAFNLDPLQFGRLGEQNLFNCISPELIKILIKVLIKVLFILLSHFRKRLIYVLLKFPQFGPI